jgi:hypothetical protein
LGACAGGEDFAVVMRGGWEGAQELSCLCCSDLGHGGVDRPEKSHTVRRREIDIDCTDRDALARHRRDCQSLQFRGGVLQELFMKVVSHQGVAWSLVDL